MGIIYQAKNTVNGKRYIGKTKNSLCQRRAGHEERALKGGRSAFNCALRKYGFDAFEWEIIYWCPDEKLNEMEIEMIAWFGTMVPNGYNLTKGGDGGATITGRTHSPETRRKISRANRGKVRSPAVRKKLSEAVKGFRHTEETKQKMSRSKRGVSVGPMSEETKRILSEQRIGKTPEDLYGDVRGAEIRAKISEARRGHLVSAETRRKISEAQKGRNQGKTLEEIHGEEKAAEIKKKLSKAQKGKKKPRAGVEKTRLANLGQKRSAETRARMSRARRAYFESKRCQKLLDGRKYNLSSIFIGA